MTREADRELAVPLMKAYPNNPSVILLQGKDSFAGRVADSLEYAKLQDRAASPSRCATSTVPRAAGHHGRRVPQGLEGEDKATADRRRTLRQGEEDHRGGSTSRSR